MASQAEGGLAELRALVERYLKADERFETALVETAEKYDDAEARQAPDYASELLSLLWDLQESRRGIANWLASNRVTRIPRDLASTLKRIRSGHSEQMAPYIEWLLPEADLEPPDVEEIFTKYFLGTYLPGRDPLDAARAAVRRRNRVGGLVVGEGVPAHVERHLETLRSCFALARFDAAVVFARSVIETAAFAALERRGRVSRNTQLKSIEEYNLVALLNSVARHIRHVPKSVLDGAHEVKDRARRILHAKRSEPPVSEHEAYACIAKTFRFVEALFE